MKQVSLSKTAEETLDQQGDEYEESDDGNNKVQVVDHYVASGEGVLGSGEGSGNWMAISDVLVQSNFGGGRGCGV